MAFGTLIGGLRRDIYTKAARSVGQGDPETEERWWYRVLSISVASQGPDRLHAVQETNLDAYRE